ncbi:MAG: response regulator [Pseudorhodobacter sp.]|nr:response regulator [Pseudorhodobacter sp.]
MIHYAMSQSAEEVRRQAVLVNRIEIRRRSLAALPFMAGMIFLPPLICLALAVANGVLELLALRLLNSTDPARQPRRYLGMLALFGLANVAHMMLPALAWQLDDPFSKAYAIGAIMVNIVHVATVRTVHFPLAMAIYGASALILLLGNSYYWVARGDVVGLFVSSSCLGVALYFTFNTMYSVHEVHAETYRERQLAEAANAAKSRFMAQMSHELRTPLNAILGMGYAEMTYAETPESQARLKTLVESARSLSVMLDDILDLSAIEAGRLLIRPKVVTLRAEIALTLALFHQQLEDSRLELQVNMPPDLPEHVMMDGQRFRQCLSNVVSNAIKYTAAGTIRIDVSTLPPNLLAIEITDTGSGVPPDLQEDIFEPFHRGGSPVPGTGLGLSISRTLARRMGGDLNLQPNATGARFRLTVAIPLATPAKRAPALLPAHIDLGQRRVLVVDDLPTNRLVAMTYLRIMGAKPEACESGGQALALIAADPPDIVLLDMLMDDLDGMQTFRCIRDLPGPAGKVPVIAMTADAGEDRRRACLAAGFDGYVSKPISPELLGAALLQVAGLPAESDMAGRV